MGVMILNEKRITILPSHKPSSWIAYQIHTLDSSGCGLLNER